jgi:hypothetical protein
MSRCKRADVKFWRYKCSERKIPFGAQTVFPAGEAFSARAAAAVNNNPYAIAILNSKSLSETLAAGKYNYLCGLGLRPKA